MAKRKKSKVPRDNVAKLAIGDVELELEASLGASVVYSNEFLGRLGDPYRGEFGADMLTAYRIARETVEESDGDGGTVRVPNPEYAGIDIVELLRLAWAMARAAGSTDQSYEDFYEDVIHQPAGLFDEGNLFATVVMRLGDGVTFRRPEGHGGAVEPDAAQEGAEG
jgi:hypothetical protein